MLRTAVLGARSRSHLTLDREKYPDFSPTRADEMLIERDGVRVSLETLRG